MDFLLELEHAGLASRLKRLSDTFLYSTKDFYKAVGADIEPNWHLVFLLLKKHEALSITDISDQLQFSHPAVIKIIKKMKMKGYVETKTDVIDSRKQTVTLSGRAIEVLPRLETYWAACIVTMQELLEDAPEFLSTLGQVEEKVRKSSYKDRTLKNLNIK